ncbi:MAG: NAD-dependent isocitrate dehydrogenase [Herpetosiphonaceae bacterium]|nr:NAD-dependent isocitrate dehydrogenase [Herpetosiphonaceae bacterium]
MSYIICLLPGDGIGQEVIPAARAALIATGLRCRFVEADIGWACFQRRGTALPNETLTAVRQADVTLLGAVGSPSHRVTGYRSPVVGLRQALDLYACVRPVRTPPLEGQRPGIDMVVIRENSEGLYAGGEEVTGAPDDRRAVAHRIITSHGSRRIAQFALDYAQHHRRQRVTLVHKANVLRESCGLFRETVLAVFAGQVGTNPVVVDELLVDTAAYHMVRSPERFDVIVTTNLFGDILSDAASAWGGGLGLAASANIGAERAVFEPVHGSAPDIAGRGIANPLAAISAAALLLDYLGETSRGDRLRTAVDAALRAGIHTPDLGGAATTAEVLAFVITHLTEENSAMTCPECEATLTLPADLIEGEIVPCPDCGAELEVTSTSPVQLQLAPMVEEDWGE